MDCAKLIIQAGIVKVVAPITDEAKYERWLENFEFSKAMMKEANLEVISYEYP